MLLREYESLSVSDREALRPILPSARALRPLTWKRWVPLSVVEMDEDVAFRELYCALGKYIFSLLDSETLYWVL